MKYSKLLLLLLMPLCFGLNAAAVESGELLASCEANQLTLSAELVSGGRYVVLRLTNNSSLEIKYGVSSIARGFVLEAKALGGGPIPYSAFGRDLFRPTIHVSNASAVLMPAKSIEFRISVVDINKCFVAPPELMTVKWSRGVDSRGDDYPSIAGLLLELNIAGITKLNNAGESMGALVSSSVEPSTTTWAAATKPVAAVSEAGDASDGGWSWVWWLFLSSVLIGTMVFILYKVRSKAGNP
jgi:hypothetical protein